MLDGERVAPDATIESEGIEEMDSLDVYVSKGD